MSYSDIYGDIYTADTGSIIFPATLPNGIQGLFYSQSLTSTGAAPFTWSISGSLPTGLSSSSSSSGSVLDEASSSVLDESGSAISDEAAGSGFSISGTPTVAGSYTFTVSVIDSLGSTGSVTYTISISSSLAIIVPALLSGTVGTPFSYTFNTVSGTGTPPITWSVGTGSVLPSGISLSSAGVLSGNPSRAGSFSFVIVATDSLGAVVSASITFNVASVTGTVLTPIPGPPAGSDLPVTAEWLDSGLVSHGFIPFTTLNAVLFYNFVGAWSMTVPYSDQMWDMVKSGDFFVSIDWKGLFTFGGKCEVPGYQFAVPTSLQSGPVQQAGETITLAGADFLSLIANRIAFPDPTNNWSNQSYTVTDSVTNMKCESAIKYYVNRNVGPAATSFRQVNNMDIATDQGRGGLVSYTAQLVSGVDLNLMDVFRNMIATGGPMGLSLTRNAHRLLFDVYIPRDLSSIAWFSKDLGNLTSVQFSLSDPTVTDALVYGKTIFSNVHSAESQWSRIEQLVDQSSETDPNKIAQAGTSVLAQGAAGPSLAVVAQDIPMLSFGRDYGLGDNVTVEVRPGDVYQDIVTSVVLNVDMTQIVPETVVPVIGYPSDPGAIDKSWAAQLAARVRKLERRLDAVRG